MPKRLLPPVKIVRKHPPKPDIMPAPHRPRLDTGNEPEVFAGQINGMKASMPEERMARALTKLGAPFEFRYTIGAPRGMPGWKEVDFLVPSAGIVYAFEVDTAFTHREKGKADVLHDALVLTYLEQQGMSMFPQVIHVDGESDLATQQNAERFVKTRIPLAPPVLAQPDTQDANVNQIQKQQQVQQTPQPQQQAPQQRPRVQVNQPKAPARRTATGTLTGQRIKEV